MKRTERHQLKQDEFVHWVQRVADWTLDNRKNLVNAVLVVAGTSLLLGGLHIYRGRQALSSQAKLSEALEQFHAPVRPEGAGPAASGPVFEDAQSKYRTALGSFREIVEEFGSYGAGRQARYYSGLCLARLSEYEEAASVLSELRSGSRDLLYYLAARALAQVQAASGDYSAAASTYRSLVEDPDNPLPADFLLFDLAKAEERAGNLEEARQYYDRVLEEFPQSQLRGDVTSRKERLELSS